MKKKKFRDLLKIDRNKINDEMKRQPELMYDIGLKIERLWQEVAIIEDQVESKKATLATTLRNKYKRSKNEKLSEAAISEMVRANPEIVELKENLLKWKKLYRIALLKKSVLKEKSEMLVNISHNVREEYKRNFTPNT